MPKMNLDWKTAYAFIEDAFVGVGVPREDAVRGDGFKVEEIVRSSDPDALDQADRVAAFFKAALGKKGTPPPIRVDAALPGRTVRVGGVELSSQDRIEFSTRVKRFLDVLNAVRYPKYRAPTPLPTGDAGRYRIYRL